MPLNVDSEFEFFLKNDFANYRDNSWVAIYNEKVISSGENLHDVINGVKKQSVPLSRVLITKVRKTARFQHG